MLYLMNPPFISRAQIPHTLGPLHRTSHLFLTQTLPLTQTPTSPHYPTPQNPTHTSSSPTLSATSPHPPFSDTSAPPSTSSTSSSPSHLPHPPHHPMITRAKDHIFKPKIHTDGTIPWPHPQSHSAQLSPTISTVPSSVTQALQSPEWREALHNEFQALQQTQTWSLVPPHPSQNVIGCKWLFRVKHKADGSVDRFKARQVAKGFHQQEGIDFADTFSPVVKPTTVRILLSIAVSQGWCLKQIDIQNALLHGHLTDTVHMVQPPGFVNPTYPHYVCKLHRSLYGLKQAPRAWFSCLSSSLTSLGFKASISDPSLFIFKSPTCVLYVLIYVDDIIITGSSFTAVSDLITTLGHKFPVKDLGNLHYFLGVEVIPRPDGILLTQKQYILDLLQRSHMHNAHLVTTPMAVNLYLPILVNPSPILASSAVSLVAFNILLSPGLTFPLQSTVSVNLCIHPKIYIGLLSNVYSDTSVALYTLVS